MLNISHDAVGSLSAIEEGEVVETPNEEWFRERRQTRQAKALAELLLTQVYFKDKKDKRPFADHIFEMIDGPRFDMKRLKPKKK